MRRVGLFGGTFDPPHVGHLMVAEWARDALGLHRVLFMPSGSPPHKRGRVSSSAATRVAMTRLAVRGNRAFEVSTLEARRRGVSYTVDTLRALRAADPKVDLYLVIGEDSLREFHTWHEPEAILDLATLVVAPRPGGSRASGGQRRSPAMKRAARGRRPAIVWLESPGLDLSSSEIRSRARSGRSVRYVVPDAVAAYIARRRLYRNPR